MGYGGFAPDWTILGFVIGTALALLCVVDQIFGPIKITTDRSDDRSWMNWARTVTKQHRRPNKPIPEFEGEKQAADRVTKFDSSGRWPGNDYVLGAALMLLGVIVLIAIAIFTGLVKP